jgi:hypothetical protein
LIRPARVSRTRSLQIPHEALPVERPGVFFVCVVLDSRRLPWSRVGGRTPPDFASGNGCRRLSPVGWSVSETGARGGRRTPAAIPGTPFHRLPYPPVTEASRPTGIASTVGRRTIDPHATGSQTQVNVQRTRFRHFFQQARATPDLALTRVSRVFSSLEAHG